MSASAENKKSEVVEKALQVVEESKSTSGKPTPASLGPKIIIPLEFATELHYVEALDSRTDAEILASLTQLEPGPVTSEKNVWSFWHSGIESMPAWCQRNIINWVRLLGPSWTIRVLDRVPNSPNNALRWIPEDLLPETFVKGTMDGPYVGPHSADFLRGAALWKYGGVWMDVGSILIRHLDKICWDKLEDEANPFTISIPLQFERFVLNAFVAARKGDEFIKRWHELFMHIWQGRTNCKGIIASPLLPFIPNIPFDNFEARRWKMDIDLSVDPVTHLDYIGQCLCWMRVSLLEEPQGGFNGVEYYDNKVLLFDGLPEGWGAEEIIGFRGEALFKVLTTKMDGDVNSTDYKTAYKTIWTILRQASFQKVFHGKNIMKSPALGSMLDRPENEAKDMEPGTFAELLRYGSMHFEQTRKDIKYIKAVAPLPETIIRKGLLEA